MANRVDDLRTNPKRKPQVAVTKAAPKPTGPGVYTAANMGSGVNSSYTATYRPDILARTQAAQAQGANVNYGGDLNYFLGGGGGGSAPQTVLPKQNVASKAASSGGRSYGGGGGGGGGPTAAQLAQTQLDAMLQMLGSQTWKAAPMTDVRNQIDARNTAITNASAQDTAAGNTAWDAYDTWTAANQRNPFQDMRFQQAQVASDQNPWLTSQGVSGNAQPSVNPDDSYGGFQSVAQLLAGAAQQSNQSQQVMGKQGRASTLTNIGAGENAYRDAIQQQLAQVTAQEYAAQQQLDQQRREAYMAIMPLLAQGAKVPADVMQQMGWG